MTDTHKDHNAQAYEDANEHYVKAITALRKKYRVLFTLTEKDIIDMPNAKVGDTMPRNPDVPDNSADAFELFKNYYAQMQFEVQKNKFVNTYKKWNKPAVEAEIADIEKWIENAKTYDYKEAVKANAKPLPQYQYIKFANGHYESNKMTWNEHHETSTAASVYGKYFLFYEYLKDMLDNFYIPSSKYLHLIEIDFENLPRYIIEKGVVNRFERQDFRKDEDYTNWYNSWGQFIDTIPKEYRLKAMQKGVEYGRKVYQYHLEKECHKRDTCRYNESWERRIAIAQNTLDKLLATAKENDKVEQQVQETNGNPEFTTARQVLAIHYLLEHCGVNNVDNTVKARFIQFLTNRQTDAKNIRNTSIYKRLKNVLGNDNKSLKNDLSFIRQYFEDLGLQSISASITKEIANCKE